MKKNIIVGVLLVIFLVGCGVEKKNSEKSEIIIEKALPTILPVEIYQDIDTLPEEIHEILYCDGTFFEVEHQKEYTKKFSSIKNETSVYCNLL